MSEARDARPRSRGKLPSKAIPGLRWWIAALLLLATFVNYLDRQTLATLKTTLQRDLGFDETGYARIAGAFMIAYMIMQAGSGRIMDRLGPRAGLALTVSFWSVAAMMHSLAAGVVSLAAFRFFLGVGEAGNWPGGVKAVGQWFPARERAFAIGLFNSGSCIGAMAAPPLVAFVTLRFGWRLAFIVTGAMGFVWVAAWLALFRRPAEHPRLAPAELAHIRSDPPEPQRAKPLRFRDLLGIPSVWGLALGRMFSDSVWWFYALWILGFLQKRFDLTLAQIGLFGWVPFLAADVGNFAGGGASSLLVRRGLDPVRARKSVMAAAAVTMLSGIAAERSAHFGACLALVSVAMFAYSAWAANMLTLPADIFPASVVASVSGLSGTGGALGGFLLQQLVGFLANRDEYAAIFRVAGASMIVGLGCVIVLVRRLAGTERAAVAPGAVSSELRPDKARRSPPR